MDNQILFELYDGVFWLSIIIVIIGLVIIAGVIWFGRKIFTRSLCRYCQDCEYCQHIKGLLSLLINRNPNHNVSTELQAILDSYVEHQERRNEFWDVYGKIVLAIFIVVILAILLITKTTSAEAGLPILSAVLGFAIAKGINSGKGTGNLINPSNNER